MAVSLARSCPSVLKHRRDFILFDTYRQRKNNQKKKKEIKEIKEKKQKKNEKKQKRKGAIETRDCERVARALVASLRLMIYPTESSLLLRCNGERRGFAAGREEETRRGRTGIGTTTERDRNGDTQARKTKEGTEEKRERERETRNTHTNELHRRRRAVKSRRKSEEEADRVRSIYHTPPRRLLIIHTRFPARPIQVETTPLAITFVLSAARTHSLTHSLTHARTRRVESMEMARPVGSDRVKRSFDECSSIGVYRFRVNARNVDYDRNHRYGP